MMTVAALALVFSACIPQTPPDTTFVVSSDPALRTRVAELLPGLADRAGMELSRPVRAERRSREELEAYLVYKLDQDLPPEEAAHLTRSYGLLGLVDEELDLRDLLLSVYTEQVAGFYDPDSTALFVMDDMDVELLETVMVHELVHAVQDQETSLDSLTADERGNDRQAAAQAAIEGHATLIMLEYMAEELRGEPVDLSTLPELSEAIGPAMEGMKDQYPALAGAPRIIQEAVLFPYLEGASFVAALWEAREGRPPPFHALLPQSTEQVMNPTLAWGESLDRPTELAVRVPESYTVLYQNTLGQLELGIFLEEHLGPEGREAARGWDGDRYLLLSTPGGEDGLVWAAVWDGREERDRFLTAVRDGVTGIPRSWSVEGRGFFGRPGVLLRVGVPDDLAVLVEEGSSG
jgi:hypothetical protein